MPNKLDTGDSAELWGRWCGDLGPIGMFDADEQDKIYMAVGHLLDPCG